MATYINIAPLQANLGGITSKGYIINKKGNSVTMKWGAIKSINRKFYWAGKNLPVSKTQTFATPEETIVYIKDKIRRRNNEDYKKLPPGKKILKYKQF